MLKSKALNWPTTTLSRDVKTQQKEKYIHCILLKASTKPSEWPSIEKHYGAVTASTSTGELLYITRVFQ